MHVFFSRFYSDAAGADGAALFGFQNKRCESVKMEWAHWLVQVKAAAINGQLQPFIAAHPVANPQLSYGLKLSVS
jgi:hypothetical protein